MWKALKFTNIYHHDIFTWFNDVYRPCIHTTGTGHVKFDKSSATSTISDKGQACLNYTQKEIKLNLNCDTFWHHTSVSLVSVRLLWYLWWQAMLEHKRHEQRYVNWGNHKYQSDSVLWPLHDLKMLNKYIIMLTCHM